jgi:hydroxymethylbilane synthase
MPSAIRIGTRGSALALIQADIAAAALRAAAPDISFEIHIIETHGDTNQDPIPLDTVGKGWFTKEIEQALLSNEIDLAVHSLKDVAEDMPPGLSLGAYLPREDARDALVSRNGETLPQLKSGAIVGTDSARRKVQILSLRPDLRVESMRGNVLTRLDKITSGEYDAAILAAAGLKRLDLENRISHFFSPEEITPSPGQGILALQSRAEDSALRALLEKSNDLEASLVAQVERTFSRAIGGGCKAPTGAYAWRENTDCMLLAMIVGNDSGILRKAFRTPWSDCSHLGQTAAQEFLSQINHGSNS